MSSIGRPGIPVRVTLPTATNGTTSNPWVVPEGAKVVSIFVPALVGTGATVLLQSQIPPLTDDESASWVAVSVFNLTDGTFTALDGMVESTCVTLPVTAIGPGPHRFVASEAQTGAAHAITVTMIFGRDG